MHRNDTLATNLSIRCAIKDDFKSLLIDYTNVGNDISYKYFKCQWMKKRFSRIHGCCPHRIERDFWFHILCDCCLELMYQTPTIALQSADITLQNNCNYVSEGIWNMSVLFALYTLFSTRYACDERSTIRKLILRGGGCLESMV